MNVSSKFDTTEDLDSRKRKKLLFYALIEKEEMT
jgi:hypothetical protein